MQKIKKIWRAIQIIVSKPYMLNLILEQDAEWWAKLKIKFPDFTTGLPTVSLEQITATDNWELPGISLLEGGSSIGDYALLRYLAEPISPCHYFEIGTFRGESLYNLSDVVDTATSLNLSSQEMRSLQLSEQLISQIGILVKDKKNVNILRGNSLNFDYTKLNKKFDLIFIDGDHHYESVKMDTANVFAHLLHENTIVVWHDYTYQPDLIRPEVFLGILDGLPKEKHQHLIHVKNTNCAVFIQKEFATEKLLYPAMADILYKVSLQKNI